MSDKPYLRFILYTLFLLVFFSLLTESHFAHLHWLVAVATQETPYFSEEPVAVATGGGYP